MGSSIEYLLFHMFYSQFATKAQGTLGKDVVNWVSKKREGKNIKYRFNKWYLFSCVIYPIKCNIENKTFVIIYFISLNL